MSASVCQRGGRCRFPSACRCVAKQQVQASRTVVARPSCVEIVMRDGSTAYAEAVRRAVPSARQGGWHLWHGLPRVAEMLEPFPTGRQATMARLALPCSSGPTEGINTVGDDAEDSSVDARLEFRRSHDRVLEPRIDGGIL